MQKKSTRYCCDKTPIIFQTKDQLFFKLTSILVTELTSHCLISSLKPVLLLNKEEKSSSVGSKHQSLIAPYVKEGSSSLLANPFEVPSAIA